MGNKQPNEQQFYIGIDGGGSKCRATIYSVDGQLLGTGVAGRANPLHGLDQTFQSIIESSHLALLDADLSLDACQYLVAGIGLAGVNVGQFYQQIIQWRHPFKVMYLTTDLHAACIGAHNGEDGAVIITGTGSCGYVHAGQQSISLGGHGFALGDKGSGAWFGLKAVEHALLALDGFACSSQLTEELLAYFKVHNAMGIVEQLACQSSSAYAKLSSIVLMCAHNGDAVAIAIVQEGANYISELARKLFVLNPSRFSIIGGLAEPLTPWLDNEIASKISPSISPPEYGAYLFGKKQFSTQAIPSLKH
jgi:glucosamine kinase